MDKDSQQNASNYATASSTDAGKTTNNSPFSAKPVKKKFPWALVLGISIPVLALLGFAIWYFAYFNNKYLVVRNALYASMSNRDNSATYDIKFTSGNNSVKANGSLAYLASGKIKGDANINATSDGTSLDLGKISFALNNDDSTFYLQLSGSDKLKSMGLDLSSIKDEWIKLDASATNNLGSLAGSNAATSETTTTSTKLPNDDLSKVQKCWQAGNDELDDKNTQHQIVDSLIDTGFLVVDTDGGDSTGRIYKVSLDGSHYGDFAKQLAQSNYVQAIDDCMGDKSDQSIARALTDTDSINQAADSLSKIRPEIKLWIKGAFDRRLTKVSAKVNSASNDSKDSVETTVTYANQAPSIDMPKDAKTVTELFNAHPELSQMITTLMTSSINKSSSPTATTSNSSTNPYETNYTNYNNSTNYTNSTTPTTNNTY